MRVVEESPPPRATERTPENPVAPPPETHITVNPVTFVHVPDRVTGTIERTIIERPAPLQGASERHTDPLPVVNVTVNLPPERKPDAQPAEPPRRTTRPETQRDAGRETEAQRPEKEYNYIPPEVRQLDKKQPEPKVKKPEVQPPAHVPVVKKEVKRSNGKPGRKNTELQHAINWILWEQTSFDKKRCPWKNPYECKKHQPPDEHLIEARRLLGFDF